MATNGFNFGEIPTRRGQATGLADATVNSVTIQVVKQDDARGYSYPKQAVTGDLANATVNSVTIQVRRSTTYGSDLGGTFLKLY